VQKIHSIRHQSVFDDPILRSLVGFNEFVVLKINFAGKKCLRSRPRWKNRGSNE